MSTHLETWLFHFLHSSARIFFFSKKKGQKRIFFSKNNRVLNCKESKIEGRPFYLVNTRMRIKRDIVCGGEGVLEFSVGCDVRFFKS